MPTGADHNIKLKRTRRAFTDTVLQQYSLAYGEPLLVEDNPSSNNYVPRFLIIGSQDDNAKYIPDEPVIRIVPRQLTVGSTVYPVAQNGIYYKNKDVNNIAELMDETATTIYPKTRASAVIDDVSGSNLTDLLANKLDKPMNATPGDMVIFNNTGNGIADSGLKFEVINGILRVTYGE